jgi:hypothetical protein
MGVYRKASIRQLASDAYQLEGRTVQGDLHRNPENGRWMVGDVALNEWLARNKGQDVTLILVPTESQQPMEKKTCRTCGREYIGSHCPYCREVRFRLRGE